MIDIYSAISSGDITALAKLEQDARNKDEFSECLHRSVGYGSFDIDMGTRRPRLTQHAALWLLPIVTRPGFASPRVNSRQNQSWVHEWIGAYQSVTSFNVLPAYEAITALMPTGPYELIETMLRLRDPSESPFADGMPESAFQNTEFPTLTFMIGTVARNGRLPEIPDPSTRPSMILRRLEAALHFENADAETLQKQGVVISAPAQFNQAIVDGLILWLAELERAMEVKAWSLDTLGAGCIGLTIAMTNTRGERCISSLPIKLWQVGSDGLELIKSHCARWPMKHTLWESNASKLS